MTFPKISECPLVSHSGCRLIGSLSIFYSLHPPLIRLIRLIRPIRPICPIRLIAPIVLPTTIDIR